MTQNFFQLEFNYSFIHQPDNMFDKNELKHQLHQICELLDAIQNAQSSFCKDLIPVLNAQVKELIDFYPPFISERPEFQDNDAMIASVVKKGGGFIQYASPRLQDHKPTALLAIKNSESAYPCLSERLKEDIDIIHELSQHFED